MFNQPQQISEEQHRIRAFLIVAISEIQEKLKNKKFSALNSISDNKLDDYAVKDMKTYREYTALNELLKKFNEYKEPNELVNVDFAKIYKLFENINKSVPKSDTKDFIIKLSGVALDTEAKFKKEKGTSNIFKK